MADRIAVMSEGRVLQVGRPAEVYERPRDAFVAGFIGETNFLQGSLRELRDGRGSVRLPSGRELEGVARAENLVPGTPVRLAIRPEKLTLAPCDGEAGSKDVPQGLDGVIEQVHYLGTDTRYHVRTEDGELIARLQNRDRELAGAYRVGDAVRVRWKSSHANLLR